MPNQDQVFSLIRTVLKMGGAYLISKGIATDSSVNDIIGGIIAVVGVVWSYYSHSDSTSTVKTPPTA